MTLIAGTIAWKGVCIGTDTRATHTNSVTQNHTYSDDILKLGMLPIGMGIAVAGNCDTASIFREVLIKNLSIKKKSDDSYDGPLNLIKEIIETSLRELALDQRVSQKPSEETGIAGLISWIDVGVPMRFGKTESERILAIVENRTIKSKIWEKYKKNIQDCAKGAVEYVELSEFPHSVLFSFESRLASRTSPGILSVRSVPFGEIEAWGSGKSNDHEEQQKNTLFYLLFEIEPEETDQAAIHILRTHAWSEKVIPVDPKYKFPTFGGGFLSGAFIQLPKDPKVVQFRVSKGNFFRKPNSDLVCSVYENSEGKLCVKTADGKEWVLTEFWNYGNKAMISMQK